MPVRTTRTAWPLGLLCALLAALVVAAPAAAGDVETKIVGGGSVSIDDHPWQVSIDIAIGDSLYMCGGSIRDATHVVTAAHCAIDDGGNYPRVLGPGAFTVGYGSANLGSQSHVGVAAVTVAPRFRRDLSSDAYDAAVLTLASPIGFGSSGHAPQAVQYATGQELDDNFDGQGFVTGWGTTAENGQTPSDNNLRGAPIPLQSDQACLNEYGDGYVPALMICAGGTGTDTCQGDSGGPLTLDVDPTGGVSRKLVGITSAGHGCARPGVPGFYTWVQSPQILQVIGNPSPAAAPTGPVPNPTVSGVVRVGRTVTCNPGSVPGATSTQYRWFQHTQQFGFDFIGTGHTLALRSFSRGARVGCDVRYEGAGGFVYAEPPAGAYAGPVGAATFFVDTKVALRLARQRTPASGPLSVVVSNANDFVITGRLSGVSHGAAIRARAFSVRSNAPRTIDLDLPKAVRNRLRSKGQVTVDLSAVVRDPAGRSRTVARTVTVKRK
ncbi:MAG TPA: serine protease [Thermoleophilaceae bacterium]|nr:serine protease [Thermoleophilaceae bacterium]